MSASNGKQQHVKAVSDFDEFAAHIQRIAEQHLNECLEAMDSWEAGEQVPSPSYAPFDGCNTCIVREVLMVTLDEVIAFVKAHPELA